MQKRRQTKEKQAQPIPTTEDPSSIAELRQRLAFLCHDLQSFSSNDIIATRLNSSIYTFMIGPPYLSEEEANFLLSCDLATLRNRNSSPSESSSSSTDHNCGTLISTASKRTLSQFLEKGLDNVIAARRKKSQRELNSTKDFVMCTSHDLAPLLQEACAFDKSDFETKAFRSAYKQWEKGVKRAAKAGKNL
ncbi:hypothetical protein C8Q75DRAFT_467832 [Abortiporus biennis]|nr:hypothetical protein C8Q75DRAFT_467832 [Abortiporus biennis]